MREKTNQNKSARSHELRPHVYRESPYVTDLRPAVEARLALVEKGRRRKAEGGRIARQRSDRSGPVTGAGMDKLKKARLPNVDVGEYVYQYRKVRSDKRAKVDFVSAKRNETRSRLKRALLRNASELSVVSLASLGYGAVRKFFGSTYGMGSNIVERSRAKKPKVSKPKPVSVPANAVVEQSKPKKLPKPKKEHSRPKVEDLAMASKPMRSQFRALAAFAVMALLFTMPLYGFSQYQELRSAKDAILVKADEGYGHLQVIRSADAASRGLEGRFAAAAVSFGEAQEELAGLDRAVTGVASVIPYYGKQLKSGEHLLAVGKGVSEAGALMASGIAAFSDDEAYLTDRLEVLSVFMEKAGVELDAAIAHASAVEPESLPAEQQQEFTELVQTLPRIRDSLVKLASVSEPLMKVLGSDRFQRYLVVFQNNAELRPSGGFMGSFALMDVDRGEIRNLEVPGGGIYDMQGSFYEKVIPPEPFLLFGSRWMMQDSNYFPDFPSSAEKLIWFYEKSGGPTVDGVIALDATVMVDLLSLTGPVDMPGYGKVITAENFQEEAQKSVEQEYDKKENRPKQFIADLAPILLDRIFQADSDEFLDFIEIFDTSTRERHVQLYFKDFERQRMINDLGWGGEIKATPRDYLAVIHTNVGGRKTDRVMHEQITHSAQIREDGSIVDTVTVARKHGGERGDDFTGENSVDYLRIYVPEGSRLLAASGFKEPDLDLYKIPGKDHEIDEDLRRIQGDIYVDKSTGVRINHEFGKTVFGNWVQTKPGHTSAATFTYELPFRLAFSEERIQDNGVLDTVLARVGIREQQTLTYSLLVQKQAGTMGSEFVSTLEYPSGWDMAWNYPEQLEQKANGWLVRDTLRADRFYAAAFIK